MVMEGAALTDRVEYQHRLAEARRKELPAAIVGNGSMAKQQLCQQVQQSRERSRKLEQEKQQLQQQVLQQGEAHQEEFNERAESAQQQVLQLQEQVSQILNTCKELPILKVPKSLYCELIHYWDWFCT